LEVVSAYLTATLDEVTSRRAGGLGLEPPAVQVHLNTLKVLAARETYRAADEMVALAGIATGYVKGSAIPLERLLRDLRAASLTYDDNLLLVSNGNLCLLDPAVTTVGAASSPVPKGTTDVD
jgi:acyl-CoA dehydrogenase